MLFNSLEFAIFLPIVWLLYWLIPSKYFKWQNVLLLAASYFFYGSWDWRFLSLIFISSLVDYWVGLRLDKVVELKRRKLLLGTSLFVNLSLLGFFKYYGFFVDSLIETVTFFGFSMQARTLQIVLPIGISFYTFQTLSYTIDLYRGKIKACRDPIAFFAFVSFFPQLIIGPIERAFRLLPQFENPRKFNSAQAKAGLRQILWGLFKKVVIADFLYQLSSTIFADPTQQSSIVLFSALVLFAFQVYADFSGYSDMAIGIAKLFGINLTKNFAFPFFSRDYMEFWQRWHISLGAWFRDYIFIPLGGSKVSKTRHTVNIFITFGISGLWHGAAGNMIIWGLSCAVLYTFSSSVGLYKKNRIVSDPHAQLTILQVGQMALTFLMFALPLVLVRCDSWLEATVYYDSLFSNFYWATPNLLLKGLPWIILLLVIEWQQRKKEHGLDIAELPSWLQWLIYFLILQAILFFGVFQQNEFFYFQF